MKLKNLSIVIALATVGTATVPATAVYNLYKKDGLSLDINGEINVHARQDQTEFSLQNPAGASTILGNNPDGSLAVETLMAGHHDEYSDRRVRLGQDEGASWTEFRGSQQLPNDWRVTGTIGFGYFDSATGMYLSNANLAFDKKNLGSVSVGRQYLHTGYVTRTGTFTPLDTFSARSIRLDYTAIPNLHLSTYYSTPSSNDVRQENSAEVEGFGVSASYRHPIAQDHSVRVAVGYTDSRKNPATTGRTSNIYAVDSQGVAGSLEYRYGGLLLAGDVGQKSEDLNGTVTKSAKSDYMGVKVGYEFSPRFSASVGYGVKDTKRTNQGAVIGTYKAEDCIDPACTNLVSASESYLFDDVKEQRAYVRGDYYLRDNVRLYGRYDQAEQQSKLNGQNFAKFDSNEYRLGVSFTF